MNIHFIAIGGSAMHNLAIALSRKGDRITGSDDEIFEPSCTRLEKEGILPENIGWDAEKITTELDAVIVGMHARTGNPELEKAKILGIKCFSYPEYIYEQTKNKKRIVIGGSHGKTTITSMILHVLHHHKKDVDYMVGAQLEGFDCMVKLSEKNKFAVLEGDEYLSSPTDRRPKFHLYAPDVALISGIAWDHVNVFPTYENYFEQFVTFIECIEKNGVCIYNADDKEVQKLIDNSTRSDIDYIPYREPEYEVDEQRTAWQFGGATIPLHIFGVHNMLNLMGAVEILYQMDVDNEQIKEAMPHFTGAGKRLETLGVVENNNFVMYNDYAHAPSKLKATLEAVREKHQKRKIVACIELHTFSSLNPDFFPHYKGAMDAADLGFVYFNPKAVAHKKLPEIDPDNLKKVFNNPNVSVWTDQSNLIDELQSINFQDSALIMMTSGNFDGVSFEQLFEDIKKSF